MSPGLSLWDSSVKKIFLTISFLRWGIVIHLQDASLFIDKEKNYDLSNQYSFGVLFSIVCK
jgi:hypothetical protein